MIPDIGLIIAAYAVARLAYILAGPKPAPASDGAPSAFYFPTVICVVAIVVIVACAADVVMIGKKLGDSFGGAGFSLSR